MSQDPQENPETPMPLEPELLALEQELLSLKPLEMDFPTGNRVVSALEQETAAFKAALPAFQVLHGGSQAGAPSARQSSAWRKAAPWAVAASLAVTGWVAFDQQPRGWTLVRAKTESAALDRTAPKATVQMVFPSAEGQQVPFGSYGTAQNVMASPLAASRPAPGPSRAQAFPEATSPYGFMGVRAYDLPDEYCRRLGIQHGLVVDMMGADSPAAQQGLEVGDIIFAFNGFPIDNVTEFAEVVRNTPPGSSVTLSIIRGRVTGKINIRLASAPSA